MITPLIAENIKVFILFYKQLSNIYFIHQAIYKTICKVKQRLRVNSKYKYQYYDASYCQFFIQPDITGLFSQFIYLAEKHLLNHIQSIYGRKNNTECRYCSEYNIVFGYSGTPDAIEHKELAHEGIGQG